MSDEPRSERLAQLRQMPLLSAPEFSELYGIGINQVRTLMRKRKLPVFPADPDRKWHEGDRLGNNDRIIVRLAQEYIESVGLSSCGGEE
jgi:hypothetical protein